MMSRTTEKQLESMTETLRGVLAALGDPEAGSIRLTQGTYGYYLAVYPDGPHRGYSTSRFGETQHKPGAMWDIIHGMLRALEGVPSPR